MFEKLKMRKYKDILFVDCENVGYVLPTYIPKTTFIYLFISDSFVLEKMKKQVNKQVQIIDLTHALNTHTKNAMDFCIVSKISEMLNVISRHQKITIVSKDKGYDAVIDYILENHQHVHISRYPFPLAFLENQDEYYKVIYKKMDDKMLKLIACYDSMKKLKKVLSKNQKKLFVVKEYVDSISGIKVMIEYDIYKHKFCLWYSGSVRNQYTSLKKAMKEYEILKNQVYQKYQKYYSKEMYSKAKQLKIHQYIEESYTNHQNLQECLMKHFGALKGMELFSLYVS